MTTLFDALPLCAMMLLGVVLLDLRHMIARAVSTRVHRWSLRRQLNAAAARDARVFGPEGQKDEGQKDSELGTGFGNPQSSVSNLQSSIKEAS